MLKIPSYFSFSSLSLTTFLLLSPLLLFSQTSTESESLTITTYYPSPYEIYNRIQSREMTIGDINQDGVIDGSDFPVNA